MKLVTAACVIATLAVGTTGLRTVDKPSAKVPTEDAVYNTQISVKGVPITIPKELQKAGKWLPLVDENYNKEGYNQWKSIPAGFILKHKEGKQLACLIQNSGSKAKTEADKVAVGFRCVNANADDPEEEKPDSAKDDPKGDKKASLIEREDPKESKPDDAKDDPQKKSKANDDPKGDKTASLIEKKSQFTPLMEKTLTPLKPTVNSLLTDNQRFVMNDINDANVEGESDASNKKEANELRMIIDRIDVGSKQPKHLKLNTRQKLFKDVPYENAQVDRDVNKAMFEFFKVHPQYHNPEARHVAAALWKHVIQEESGNKSLFSGDQATDSESLNLIPESLREHLTLGGNEGEGEGNDDSIWQGCGGDNMVPKQWPDVPTLKCKSFAISPTGFWGCNWLQSDGTCGSIKFYPNVRWDGLDAYVTGRQEQDGNQSAGAADFMAHAGKDYSIAY